MSIYLFILILIIPLIMLSIFLFRYRRELVELRKENREIQEKWSNFLEAYTLGQAASEEEFRKVCNSFEDQDWIVYRNVTFHWRDGGSKTNPLKQGEIDFLLVHKNYGIVIVEVKGGRGWRFNATNNEWKIVKGEDEEIKNRGPYEQVERNKNGLGQRIYREAKKMGIKEFSPKINSFVVWTNVKSNEEQFGFVGTEDNTLYADDLTNPKELEKRILSHFTRVEMDDKNLLTVFQKILNDNIKGFSLVTHNGKITEKFEKMSKDIFQTYYEITNKLYRKIKIKGIPGSGKTFLASKLAEDEVENQKKVMFMCYNKLLGEKLEQDFNNFENIEVIIFEDFIAGLGITYDDKLMIDGKEVYSHD